MAIAAHYYDKERRKGWTLSALMHFLFLLLALLGLPDFLKSRPPEEPEAITVELLPITGITNVKPSEEPKPETKQEKPPVKPTPPVKTEEAKQEPKKEEVPNAKVPAPKEKEEPKKDKKAKPEDLMAVLKAVKDQAKSETKPNDAKKAVSNQYTSLLPMSMSEKDAIRSQIAKCWNVPAGAKDAQNLAVTLRIEVAQDGSVMKVSLASDESRYESDSFFRAAADSAIRAVRECSPLQNLPPEKYETWRDMELTFDPKQMLF